ncbi:chaperone NapD [Janthinobacterium sp. 17J80-10]|uniref:chaperone NapD n=1 Tax=Janthinobacterium sp. 17J80-10 TaxID=2497863 RepID=UPI0013E8A412|nr:chaperone NapD [Janthinobacterium sp. 17J80-10]
MTDSDNSNLPGGDREIHIAGIIAYCDARQVDAIKARISLLPGAECHAQSAEGKLVITLETESTRRTVDCMDAIRALPGVYDVSLVYQHAEPATAMEQEMEP